MSLRISLIQTNLHWEDKLGNMAMLERKINAISEPTHIIVLPEMFTTGFSMRPEELAEPMDGPSIAWMKTMAAHKKVILTGSLIIKEGEHYFNRLIWMLPNGENWHYDKRHLFGYGGEDEHYRAGEKRVIASVNKWKINLQVCYDLRFPVWARAKHSHSDGSDNLAPAHEYDVLLYVANWPDRRAHAWKSLLVARAIENQCYVVAVNRVGNDGNGIYHNGASMVIDPLGELLYLKENDEDIFTVTLNKDHLEKVRAQFPFWRDADTFLIQ